MNSKQWFDQVRLPGRCDVEPQDGRQEGINTTEVYRSVNGTSLNAYLDSGDNVSASLVQALRLCTGRTARKGSRGIALLFHDQRH